MVSEATLAIREAMSLALSNQAVHAKLPTADAKLIRPIMLKDEAKWSDEEHTRVFKTFSWAAQNRVNDE